MAAAESHPREDTCWLELHEWFVSTAKTKEADVLFIGGDHIALLQQSQFYLEKLAPLHCVSFGALGDTAANLLWRVQNGEAENFTPKVIVVSVGQSEDVTTAPEVILQTLRRIAETLKDKQPQAEIFFLQLLPSGRRENSRREFATKVNAELETTLKGLADVIQVDCSLVDQSGEIDVHHMFDFVHLSQAGYEKVFQPVLTAINSVFHL